VRASARLPALLGAAFLLSAAGPADLAGRYALSGVMEAAGGLELRPDGTFSYGLSYGALDEQAEGKWRVDGNRVLLTTSPTPQPPEFRLAEAIPGEPDLFRLKLENPSGAPIANIEVVAKLANGSEERTQTRTDWLEAPLDPAHQPVSVRFIIPVFDVTSPAFPVDVKQARSYRFVLDPKDLGVRDFRDWPLEIRGDLLAPEGAPGSQGFRRLKAD
jgi:hypothetical protein